MFSPSSWGDSSGDGPVLWAGPWISFCSAGPFFCGKRGWSTRARTECSGFCDVDLLGRRVSFALGGWGVWLCNCGVLMKLGTQTTNFSGGQRLQRHISMKAFSTALSPKVERFWSETKQLWSKGHMRDRSRSEAIGGRSGPFDMSFEYLSTTNLQSQLDSPDRHVFHQYRHLATDRWKDGDVESLKYDSATYADLVASQLQEERYVPQPKVSSLFCWSQRSAFICFPVSPADIEHALRAELTGVSFGLMQKPHLGQSMLEFHTWKIL